MGIDENVLDVCLHLQARIILISTDGGPPFLRRHVNHRNPTLSEDGDPYPYNSTGRDGRHDGHGPAPHFWGCRASSTVVDATTSTGIQSTTSGTMGNFPMRALPAMIDGFISWVFHTPDTVSPVICPTRATEQGISNKEAAASTRYSHTNFDSL